MNETMNERRCCQTRPGLMMGLVIAAVGLVLLLRNLGVMELRFNDIWPVAVALLGIKMILEGLSEPGGSSTGSNKV
ncbi:MAG: hypothetical protein GY940_00780 [bacterium]|nr:hypothetical protein [bacterium]